MPNTHSKLADNRRITSFFRPVDVEQHQVNTEIDRARLQVLLLEERKKELAANAALKEKLVSDIKRRLDAEADPAKPDKRSREEIIRDEIDIATADNGADIFIPKKTWTKREIYWQDIAKYAIEHGNKAARRDYPEKCSKKTVVLLMIFSDGYG